RSVADEPDVAGCDDEGERPGAEHERPEERLHGEAPAATAKTAAASVHSPRRHESDDETDDEVGHQRFTHALAFAIASGRSVKVARSSTVAYLSIRKTSHSKFALNSISANTPSVCSRTRR